MAFMSVTIKVVDSQHPEIIIVIQKAPIGSNLHKVMTLGHQQYPEKFSFKVVEYEELGSYVTCINGVCEQKPIHWMIYGSNDELLPKGIDNTTPKNGDTYTWKYEYAAASACDQTS
ncbi:uncharacterized protein [Amphiura filiformis]|uniref:uncharacterized protein n=1 Tax=Amphiura filiformis TaxID=82378 RepID=UPI003B21890E